MLDPDQLAAVAAVLRTGSFDRAAAQLNITRSAVSQRIRALEERVGTPLVRRGQPCTGTAAGLRVARHAEEVAHLAHDLASDLRGMSGIAPPTVRIAVTNDSLATWIVPALAEFPDWQFDVVPEDQAHGLDLLRRGEVSAAIAGETHAVQGGDVFPLGKLRYVPTASPDFVARWFPQGVTASALARAPMLTFNAKDRLQVEWLGTYGRRVAPPTHLVPSSQGFLEATMLGMGWGMNPEPLARDPLRAGRLVLLSPDRPIDVGLNWHVTRSSGGALAPLTAAVRRAAMAVLLQ